MLISHNKILFIHFYKCWDKNISENLIVLLFYLPVFVFRQSIFVITILVYNANFLPLQPNILLQWAFISDHTDMDKHFIIYQTEYFQKSCLHCILHLGPLYSLLECCFFEIHFTTGKQIPDFYSTCISTQNNFLIWVSQDKTMIFSHFVTFFVLKRISHLKMNDVADFNNKAGYICYIYSTTQLTKCFYLTESFFKVYFGSVFLWKSLGSCTCKQLSMFSYQ